MKLDSYETMIVKNVSICLHRKQNKTKRKKCHGAIIIDAKGAVDSSSIFSLLLLFAHSRTRFFAAFTFLYRFIK